VRTNTSPVFSAPEGQVFDATEKFSDALRLSALAPGTSTQHALALPEPAPSNTVVIYALCSLRIEGDQRVIVVAGLPVHHYRA